MDETIKSRRLLAFIIDFVGYTSLLLIFYMSFIGLPLISMGNYTEVQKNAYLVGTPLAYAFFFVQHVCFHHWNGASVGQGALGLQYFTVGGDTPPFNRVIARAALATSIFPTILLFPGPFLGFTFGPSSNEISIVFLIIGIACAAWLSLKTNGAGQTATEKWSGQVIGLRP